MKTLIKIAKVMLLTFVVSSCTTPNKKSEPTIAVTPATEGPRVIQQFSIDPELQAQLPEEVRETAHIAPVDKSDTGKGINFSFKKSGGKGGVEISFPLKEQWMEGSDVIEIDLLYTDPQSKQAEIVGSAFYDLDTKTLTLNRLCNEEFGEICQIDYAKGTLNLVQNPE